MNVSSLALPPIVSLRCAVKTCTCTCVRCASPQRTFTSPGPWPLSYSTVNREGVLVNVSSLALPPLLSQFVRPSVTKLAKPSREKGRSQNSRPPSRKKARSQNSRPHPEKRLGHKTRDPIPKKGSVTKLETPSRKKARSQNSRAHPEKRLGHKTREPIPKKGSTQYAQPQ